MIRQSLALGLVALMALACSKPADKSPAKQDKPATGATEGAAQKPKDDHALGGHTHKSLEVGQAQAGPFTVKASRDEGELKAGAEMHLDIEATGATFAAIRAWVGTPDAKGSRKSLGEVEYQDRPAHRHFHVEMPNPIPSGSKLHVEVDGGDGKTHTASFDLKL